MGTPAGVGGGGRPGWAGTLRGPRQKTRAQGGKGSWAQHGHCPAQATLKELERDGRRPQAWEGPRGLGEGQACCTLPVRAETMLSLQNSLGPLDKGRWEGRGQVAS